MKYYSPSIKGFPKFETEDSVQISDEKYEELLAQSSLGKVIDIVDGEAVAVDPVLTGSEIESIERAWRNSELIKADHEINKHVDSDPTATATLAIWKTYRINLRDWPDHAGFPYSGSRPAAPF